MVEEQRVQIGTMKALGYGKAAIAGKYIGYALIATLGGSIFGVLAGEKILPFIIIYAYMILYKHLPGDPGTVPYELCTPGFGNRSCLHTDRYDRILLQRAGSRTGRAVRPAAPKQGKRILLERIGII